MEGDMFGNTMWAGHWLWMLVIGIVVVIPVDGGLDTYPHRQSGFALLHRF